MTSVFKIRSNDGWYGHSNGFNRDEDDATMFTNRSKALKKVRDARSVAATNIEMLRKFGDKVGPFGMALAEWECRLLQWSQAEMVEFRLVRMD